MSFGSGAMTNSIPDIAEADCIFVIGSNTPEQHPLIARRIEMAKERGAKIVVADPRIIPLVCIADVFLRQRPGSDAALINGMMKVIIDHDLQDKKFIEERTEGFEDFVKSLDDYPLSEVEKITQVPAQDIEEAALLYAQAERGTILYAMGITQHITGTDNVLSLANLAMLTGNIGRPGTGVNPLRGQNNVQGACDVGCLPNVLPAYQVVTDAERRANVAKVWGVAELPAEVGLTVVEMTNAAVEGKLKAMYIIGENPMVSDPDINHVRHGLESLDFLVVQDIFLTETAELADVVLPSACWAEKDGTFTATDRRVQRIRQAIEPPGEAKPDWEILCAVAKELGAEDLFAFASAGEIFEELRKVTPSYAGITLERLNRPEGLQWPCPTEEHPGTPILHTQQFTRGRGKFYPVGYRAPAEEPDEEYPFLLTTGRTLFHYHTRTMTGRSPSLDSEVPEGHLEINPLDAEKLGIEDGDVVQVSSRRGTIEIKAFVTEQVREGVVFMPFHFAEGAANILTNSALDPIAKIPELKVCAVKIQANPDFIGGVS